MWHLESEKSAGNGLDMKTLKELAEDMLGLVYGLHTRGYAHRDIKPENFLVTESKTLLLTDFGNCIDCNAADLDTAYGTTGYKAPEILKIEEREIEIGRRVVIAIEKAKKEGKEWNGRQAGRQLKPWTIKDHKALDMWALGAILLIFRIPVRYPVILWFQSEPKFWEKRLYGMTNGVLNATDRR